MDSPAHSATLRTTTPIRLVRTQFRIIMALAIRAMEVEYAKYRMGFAWAFIEPALYVGLLSAVHTYLKSMGASTLHGMTSWMFIVCGVMPWRAFALTAYVYRTPTTSVNLRSLPGVTTLDVVIAEALSDFCVVNVIFLVFSLPSAVIEHTWPTQNLMAIILIYNSAWLLGLSFGLCMAPIYAVWPAIDHLMTSIMRIGFWTSGLFFVASAIPPRFWVYVSWNPMLNVTELLRSAWFPVYQTPIGNPYYIGECIMVFGGLGLVFERVMRRFARQK